MTACYVTSLATARYSNRALLAGAREHVFLAMLVRLNAMGKRNAPHVSREEVNVNIASRARRSRARRTRTRDCQETNSDI